MTRRRRTVSDKNVVLAGLLLGVLAGGLWCAMPERRPAVDDATSWIALDGPVPGRGGPVQPAVGSLWTGLPGSATMHKLTHSPQIVGTGLLVLILGSVRPLSDFLGGGH